MLQASDGNFYGTTFNNGSASGQGTVFKITPGGALTTLVSFGVVNGAFPQGPLVQAADGNFYGTILYGPSCVLSKTTGCGTFFKMTPAGVLTTLHTFCEQQTRHNCTDGAYPTGLIEATDGNFYGTTIGGGTHNVPYGGGGTIYRITPAGKLTTIHSFCAQSSCPDGISPYAVPIHATDGNLYGTTYQGGTHGEGAAFKLTPGGAFTTLYNFCSQSSCADGSLPTSALLQATDGNLYGTTSQGGNLSCGGIVQGCGTLFKITPEGALTTLHIFEGTDGDFPEGLMQYTDGSIYGVVNSGGNNGHGTVFSLSLGLGPFMSLARDSGKVGQRGGILGQKFTGTTGVSFNGTPATFTVVSDAFIQATVPVGSSSGYVTVNTPGGTLTSNVPFQVTL